MDKNEILLTILQSQLYIETARLASLEKDYATHSNICLPLRNATEAVIASINGQIKVIYTEKNHFPDKQK
jgi:hypothetical protein